MRRTSIPISVWPVHRARRARRLGRRSHQHELALFFLVLCGCTTAGPADAAVDAGAVLEAGRDSSDVDGGPPACTVRCLECSLEPNLCRTCPGTDREDCFATASDCDEVIACIMGPPP